VAQSAALTEQIHEQLATHVDGDIFTSLPRAGRVWAARLRVEIGDARGRYPTPEALVCAAGITPSTRQSGKVTIVSFRWSADRQLRDAVCKFAVDSRAVQRLGRGSLQPCPRPRARSPACGAGPCSGVAACDLAVLARRRQF